MFETAATYQQVHPAQVLTNNVLRPHHELDVREDSVQRKQVIDGMRRVSFQC